MPTTLDTLLLRVEVVVDGRDGIGGGWPRPPSLLVLKLKLLALFCPLQLALLLLLLCPIRAGNGGAASPSEDSEVLPCCCCCCFFFNANSYMSPKIPAKVFLRFFIVSSASSTTDDWD